MGLLVLSPLNPISPISPISPLSPFSHVSPLSLTSEMDFNPFQDSANFVELLNSQQNVIFGSQGSVSLSSSQAPFVGSQEDPIIELQHTSMRLLIWLVVKKGEASQCKQHWHKLNDLVCKFCGAFEAATRDKTSGINENDVLKLAHGIFINNHHKKFTLDHAWKELRADQKCSKRRKFQDGSHSANSHVNVNKEEDDGGTCRPPGVKAAKARGKKLLVEGKQLSDFETMWSIKKEDLSMKEKLLKMKLLESLVAKQVPLADCKEALKEKLINELI
ncbi:hypothetical protein N665_0054s0046 [Sinapis alba]|nr:hypothetical protein N665_0054s0046 [Sinapis alba]